MAAMQRRRAAAIWVLSLAALGAMSAQQVQFVRIDGPDAPKGASVLFQDSHGGLWFGGAEGGAYGLWYFDGTRFFEPFKGVYPAAGMAGMAEDSEGGIWIATLAGVYRVHEGRLKRVFSGVTGLGITRIAPDIFLAPFATANAGKEELRRISRAENGWKAEVILPAASEVSYRVDRAGNVLFGCEGGFCEFKSEDAVQWRPGTTLAITRHLAPAHSSYATARSVVWRDRSGCIWLRNSNEASYLCPGDSNATTLPASIVSVGTPNILELADGSVVMAGYGKIAIGRPGNFRVLTAQNGYPSTGDSLVTRDGTLWLSNANGQFVMPMHLPLEFWSEHDGLEYNTWSVLRVGERMYAIAGDSIRVLDPDRRRWTPIVEIPAPTCLVEGPGNTILAGTRSNGVVQLDANGTTLAHSDPFLVRALARTRGGEYWAAGDKLAQITFEDQRLALRPARVPDFPSGGWDLKAGPDGTLWAWYGDQLLYLERGEWRGLSQPIGAPKTRTSGSIAIDHAGGIWYASADAAALSYLPGTAPNPLEVRTFASGSGVGVPSGTFFHTDRRGWLWRGSPVGVYVANPEQALQGHWLYLNRTDGLPALDTNQKSFFEDSDGSIWFGADSSVIHLFPPDDMLLPRAAPSIFVSGFSWDGGSPRMAATVRQFVGRDVVAHIGSLQMDRRSGLRLRYRMLPGNAAWLESASLDLPLGRPSWGAHTLEVQARLLTGPWSGTTSKTFTILTPVWLRWPAIAVYLLVAVALGAAAFWIRRKRAADAELLPDLATWRLGALLPDIYELAGAVLDSRFEIGELLARGGFANVFTGYDRLQNSRCAIKVFRGEVGDRSWIRRRFEQEVAALQQIRHPNVVSIYAHGFAPSGLPYLVMAFVEGRSLREVLASGALPPRRAARFLRQLAGALEAIHARNVWHRDVKPENIVVRDEGSPEETAVLIDFSIAIVKDANETLHGLSRAAGSFDYMAPEQAIGYAHASSDIYSLSKVVIEMLTGQRVSQLLPDAAMDLPDRVRDLLANRDFGLSDRAIETLAAALEFDPAKRPSDVDCFANPLVSDLESGFMARAL
jgi:tRNA A-37 threonylcarbamoyl transferase component Bud32/ligand-binding sensor domain-containing protein